MTTSLKKQFAASFACFGCTVYACFAGMRPEQLYKSLAEQAVMVETVDEYGRAFTRGSGTVLGRSMCTEPSEIGGSDILSNFHVVEFAGGAFVIQSNGSRAQARVVFADAEKDLVILRANLSGTSEATKFADSWQVGQKAFALGAPKGLGWTFSDGLISGKRVQSNSIFIQTTAPISPGSSGGGLFDENGRLLGVTTLQMTEGQNLNFAISLERVIVDELNKRREGLSRELRFVNLDDWIVGQFYWPTKSPEMWKAMDARWIKWTGYLNLLRSLGQVGGGDNQTGTLAFHDIHEAWFVMRKAVLQDRFLNFPRDMEGLAAAVSLQRQAEKNYRNQATEAALQETVQKRSVLVSRIPEDRNNCWIVTELRFYEALEKNPASAYGLLSKFAESLPNKKDVDAEIATNIFSVINSMAMKVGASGGHHKLATATDQTLREIFNRKGWIW